MAKAIQLHTLSDRSRQSDRTEVTGPKRDRFVAAYNERAWTAYKETDGKCGWPVGVWVDPDDCVASKTKAMTAYPRRTDQVAAPPRQGEAIKKTSEKLADTLNDMMEADQ